MTDTKSEYTVTGKDATGRHAFSVDLNLTESEQTTLSVVLREALERAGFALQERDGKRDVHPNSHLGLMVSLYRRIYAARHGSKTWNQGR